MRICTQHSAQNTAVGARNGFCIRTENARRKVRTHPSPFPLSPPYPGCFLTWCLNYKCLLLVLIFIKIMNLHGLRSPIVLYGEYRAPLALYLFFQEQALRFVVVFLNIMHVFAISWFFSVLVDDEDWGLWFFPTPILQTQTLSLRYLPIPQCYIVVMGR